jgi:hypothetical protein
MGVALFRFTYLAQNAMGVSTIPCTIHSKHQKAATLRGNTMEAIRITDILQDAPSKNLLGQRSRKASLSA